MPNLTVMAPGDAADVGPMLQWSLRHDGPVAIRYPKAASQTVERPGLEPCSRAEGDSPIEPGKAEVLRWGEDGMLVACGTMFCTCVDAAKRLAQEGLDFGVINARFVKPLDRETIVRAVAESPLVVTVEEGALMGGFGSAVLEVAADAGLNTSVIHRLGIPDHFIEHASRGELLADLGLDVEGITRTCRELAGRECQATADAVAKL